MERQRQMRRLYLLDDREEIERRKKLLDQSLVVEIWQDLYAPDVFWMGDDETRRITYTQRRERPAASLYWTGEESKRALDSVGRELGFLLAVDDNVVPVYYGPRLTDVESLPREESLKARVLSAHGIAVAWITYDQFGERNQYQPNLPTDPVFYLRKPGGHTVHLWRLLRTKREAVIYMSESFGKDPEAVEWAKQLGVENFDRLIGQFGQKGESA
jgi:hypothetical protein